MQSAELHRERAPVQHRQPNREMLTCVNNGTASGEEDGDDEKEKKTHQGERTWETAKAENPALGMVEKVEKVRHGDGNDGNQGVTASPQATCLCEHAPGGNSAASTVFVGNVPCNAPEETVLEPLRMTVRTRW